MNDDVTWSPGVTLDQLEKMVILKAFRHYRGNKTVTSNALGIAIRTLDNKLAKYEEEGKENDERIRIDKLKREDLLNRHRGLPSSFYEPQKDQRKASLLPAHTELPLEPSQDPAEKQPVPVQERQEVQEVLPNKTPARDYRRGAR